uniref:uncharacterized protein LOC120346079 isoform X1 n=1 Tax=Styela clava TaxID=7725 RepID=UPI001939505B|nr:uncharacterized protein LOC120346079 isoform X1 [Styela clava]
MMGENPPGVDVLEGVLQKYACTINNCEWDRFCRALKIPPWEMNRWKMSTLCQEEKYQMIQGSSRKDPNGVSERVQDYFGSTNGLLWNDGGELDAVTVYGIIDRIPKSSWPRFARLVLKVNHARFSPCNLSQEQKLLMLKEWSSYQHPSVDIRAKLEEAYRALGPMLQGPTHIGTLILNAENVHVTNMERNNIGTLGM